MPCEGLVQQARDEHISQTNTRSIQYYLIGAPESMGKT